jgi:hypothetical protein
MNKTVKAMIETVENGRKNVCTRNGRMYEYGYKGNLEQHWKVEKTENGIAVYKWSTKIFEIDSNNLKVYLYVQSKSDSDIVNALLDYYFVEGVRVGFKPVNGGAYMDSDNPLYTVTFEGYQW